MCVFNRLAELKREKELFIQTASGALYRRGGACVCECGCACTCVCVHMCVRAPMCVCVCVVSTHKGLALQPDSGVASMPAFCSHARHHFICEMRTGCEFRLTSGASKETDLFSWPCS